MEVLELNDQVSPDMALRKKFFQQMQTIRTVEDRLLQLFSEGRLNGTVHTCLGQEACAVGVVNALQTEKDVVFSNKRRHAPFLAFCPDAALFLTAISPGNS